MEQDSLPTEIILSHSHETLERVILEGHPQPGSYLELAGKTYAVLERRHRYQLRDGRYQLHTIVLSVQASPRSDEKSWVNGRWTLGDATCRFHAGSELVRCAVYPSGPCYGCRFYEPAISQA